MFLHEKNRPADLALSSRVRAMRVWMGGGGLVFTIH